MFIIIIPPLDLEKNTKTRTYFTPYIIERGRQRKFDKGPRMFSEDTYMIIDINGNSFTLWNDDGPAARTYRYHELRKVS